MLIALLLVVATATASSAVPPDGTWEYDGVVISVTGDSVRLRFLKTPPRQRATFTILKASGKEPIAHITPIRLSGDEAEAKVVRQTAVVAAGDWVIAGERELVTTAGPAPLELPTTTEKVALAAILNTGRLDLPSALLSPAGLFGEVTVRGAQMSGREFRATEQILHGSPSSRWYLWFGRQKNRLRGRDRRNRFETDCLRYGFRYRLINGSEDRGLSFSYESFRPDDGVLTTPGTTATMKGPRGHTLSLLQSRRGPRSSQHVGLSYSWVRIPTDRAQVLAVGAGLDLLTGQNSLFQSNATFFYTRWGGSTITNWVFLSAFAYYPAPWARLEASIGYAPRGFPVAGHPLTGISSFLLHRPGGLVRDFTRSPGGFLTLRLVIGTTF